MHRPPPALSASGLARGLHEPEVPPIRSWRRAGHTAHIDGDPARLDESNHHHCWSSALWSAGPFSSLEGHAGWAIKNRHGLGIGLEAGHRRGGPLTTWLTQLAVRCGAGLTPEGSTHQPWRRCRAAGQFIEQAAPIPVGRRVHV